jgi:hypothetical protein
MMKKERKRLKRLIALSTKCIRRTIANLRVAYDPEHWRMLVDIITSEIEECVKLRVHTRSLPFLLLQAYELEVK